MPFVRFSRDRRGYEHSYLIDAAPRRGAPTRILYWYRTPPGIRVGKEAFDVEARRMLEAQYPSVSFDWPKLLETAMPPPEAENWRERRRVERSARQARQIEEPEEAVVEPVEIIEPPLVRPIPELAVEQHLPVAVDAAETDSAASENAARKRRRRGGRRRRRPGSPVDSSAPADPTPDADTESPSIHSTSGPEPASRMPPAPSSPDSPGDFGTKEPE